jgi:hypothetical protein
VIQDVSYIVIWTEMFYPEVHYLMDPAYRLPLLPRRIDFHCDGGVVIVVVIGLCVACLADPRRERGEESVDRSVQQQVRFVQDT